MKIAKTRRLSDRGYYLLSLLLFFGPIPFISWGFQEYTSYRDIPTGDLREINFFMHFIFGNIITFAWSQS